MTERMESSPKCLSGMSSSRDVAAHLFCSFEMSSFHLIGKFFRPPLKRCGDGELHRLTSAENQAVEVTEMLFVLIDTLGLV